MRLPARYLRKVRIPLVTLGTERFIGFGAPAAHAHAHIQHIFLFILRFSPHSSPSVKAKPPTPGRVRVRSSSGYWSAGTLERARVGSPN